MEPLRVELDDQATAAEIDQVRSAFQSEAIAAEVSGDYSKPRPGLEWGEGDEPEWIIRIVVAYGILRFLDGLIAAAGADAWTKLKRLGERLRDARRSNPPWQGSVQFIDGERETVLSMIPEPPSDEAWQTIFELDWNALPESGRVVVQWQEHYRAWVAFGVSPATSSVSLWWDRDAPEWREWDQGEPPGS